MRHPWFAKNRNGQALMEYVLLIALIATCLVAILGLTRKAANDAYTRTSDKLGPMGGRGIGSVGGTFHPSADGAPKPTPTDSGGGAPPDSAGGASPLSPRVR